MISYNRTKADDLLKPFENPHSSLRTFLLSLRLPIVLCLVISGFSLFGMVYVQAEKEQAEVRRLIQSNQTAALYQTSHVCGIKTSFDTNGTISLSYELYASVEEAEDEDATVAHCGNCGKCSNAHDVSIYDRTRHTLFQSSKFCGWMAAFGGRDAARLCLEHLVGFTEGCNDCWVDNIACDLELCWYSCIRNRIYAGLLSDGIHDGSLNDCTRCDEMRCGPNFVQCAGANRRRVGIISDLDRSDQEICKSVDTRWWQEVPLIDDALFRMPKEQNDLVGGGIVLGESSL